MKKVVATGFAKMALLAMVAIIAASASAKAQSLEYRLTANIPFDFTVNNKKLPAGEYSIRRAQPNNGDLVLQITSADGHTNISRITFGIFSRDPKNEGTLVFHRYGDEYFLNEVWPAGGGTGRALPKSRSEREVQQKSQDAVGMEAMKTREPQTVTIVANQH